MAKLPVCIPFKEGYSLTTQNTLVNIRKLTLMHYFPPSLSPHSSFASCPSDVCSSRISVIQSRMFHLEIISSSLPLSETVSYFLFCFVFFTFITLILLKIMDYSSSRLSLSLSLMFPCDKIQCKQLWQEHHRSNALFFSLHHIRWHIISICCIADDVFFDHLIWQVFAWLLHYKVMIYKGGKKSIWGEVL